MHPKDTAITLVLEYYQKISDDITLEQSKEYALIAVNAILSVLWHTHSNAENWRYYLEVKQEIEKL
jgi:hypothetical protein